MDRLPIQIVNNHVNTCQYYDNFTYSVCSGVVVRPKWSKLILNHRQTASWILKYLSQICCGVSPSSKAFVSVAVPYSSVPQIYNVLLLHNRENLMQQKQTLHTNRLFCVLSTQINGIQICNKKCVTINLVINLTHAVWHLLNPLVSSQLQSTCSVMLRKLNIH